MHAHWHPVDGQNADPQSIVVKQSSPQSGPVGRVVVVVEVVVVVGNMAQLRSAAALSVEIAIPHDAVHGIEHQAHPTLDGLVDAGTEIAG